MISTINTFLLNNQIVAESDATNNFLSYFITKPILRVYSRKAARFLKKHVYNILQKQLNILNYL